MRRLWMSTCFNEAAGFTRRKPLLTGVRTGAEQALLQ